jgi:hypothetical protein
MARIDHTACTHPRTPAGRRACRAGNAAPVVVVAAAAPVFTGLVIETSVGRIRTGSVIEALGYAGANEIHTVISVDEDIKNGYAGWVAAGRWGYVDQVVRVIKF